MTQESSHLQIVPGDVETNSIPTGSHVVLEDGQPARLAANTDPDEIRAIIERGRRPDVISINTHPNVREVRNAIARVASEHHGAITRTRQKEIADRLRNSEE